MLGLVPGVVWILFFYVRAQRPRARPFEPVLRVAALAAAFTVPAAFLEQATGATIVQRTILKSALVSLFLIGPIEELAKLIAVWLGVYRTPSFQRPTDGLVYAATAAISFASVENVVYLTLFGPGVILWRAAFATTAHALFSCMWGYSLGVARFRNTRESVTILKGFLLACVLHATYNLLVVLSRFTGPVILLPFMVLMGGLTAFAIVKARAYAPYDRHPGRALVICPACGALMNEDAGHCDRCGVGAGVPDPYLPRYCGICRAELDPFQDRCPRCGADMPIAGQAQPARQCAVDTPPRAEEGRRAV